MVNNTDDDPISDWRLSNETATTTYPDAMQSRIKPVALSVFGKFIEHIKSREASLPIILRAVFMGLGCLVYFHLPYEPLLLPWAILCVVTLLFGILPLFPFVVRQFLFFISFFALGMSSSIWHTSHTDTQTLVQTVETGLTGRVSTIEHRLDGRTRYTIDIEPQGLDVDTVKNFKGKVRITDRAGSVHPIELGDIIAGHARLAPPSGPAYPDGYSPAFQSWFSGIGATGFFLSRPDVIATTPSQGFWEHIADIRYIVASKIRDILPNRAGGLTIALVVGDRSGITPETNEYLRRSGLAHILAISGLHMSIVSIAILVTIRYFISLFSYNFSSFYDIKKFSSLLALLFIAMYYLLSGGPVSAQRAFIMIAIMLTAVQLNRRAISMRNVSYAFTIILLLSPHSILSAGLHLSFSAVVGLVAVFDILADLYRKYDYYDRIFAMKTIKKFFVKLSLGLVLTTFIAGLSTLVFTAYHFHLIAPYGLLANIFALPIVSFILMPSALLSVILMPLNLHSVSLYVTYICVEYVVQIGRIVSSFSDLGLVGYIPTHLLVIFIIGFLVICLLRSPLRFVGVIPISIFLISLPSISTPHILVSANGKQVGIIEHGNLSLLSPKSERYVSTIWQGAFTPSSNARPTSDIFDCHDNICTATIADTKLTISDHCVSSTDILLTLSSSPDCPEFSGIHLKQSDLTTYGSHSIDLTTHTILRSLPESKRPWLSSHLAN